jgi:hypothetical protein
MTGALLRMLAEAAAPANKCVSNNTAVRRTRFCAGLHVPKHCIYASIYPSPLRWFPLSPLAGRELERGVPVFVNFPRAEFCPAPDTALEP